MSRLERATLLATCTVLLAGCAALADVRDPTPPPDAVQIRVYTTGGIGGPGVPESIHWTFRSLGSGPEWGVVTHIPEATCVAVGAEWSLSIDDGGAAIPTAKSRHDQFSGASPLDLMIDRDRRGRVMKDKSHKGQRYKGCGLCDTEKRAGNGAERRPFGDRRAIARADAAVAEAE